MAGTAGRGRPGPVVQRAPASGVAAPQPVPVSDCLMAVTIAFGLSHAEITGFGLARRAARGRRCFCWLASLTATAGPKEIGRRINRDRRTVADGVAFVNGHPGAGALRDAILLRLGIGRLGTAELIDLGRRLELLTRPANTMEG